MKVNINSWHHKLFGLFDEEDRPNVCSYVRGVLLYGGLCVLLSASLLFAAIAAITPILYLFGVEVGENLMVLGVVLYGLSALALIAKGVGEAVEKSRGIDNVFTQFVSDQHSKVCTKIEFVEE